MKKTTMCNPILKRCPVAVQNIGYIATNQLWALLGKIKVSLNKTIQYCIRDKLIVKEGFFKTTKWRELSLEATLCDLCGSVWEGM